MKIRIYAIAKKQNRSDFAAKIAHFGVALEEINIFNAAIERAQKTSPHAAKIAYGTEFGRFLGESGGHFGFTPEGEEIDTQRFAQILQNALESGGASFYIGGAFGLEAGFLKKTKEIALSRLTLSHEIARIVALEQIYRALCIIHHHPYHKI